jgi:hypothetical protein
VSPTICASIRSIIISSIRSSSSIRNSEDLSRHLPEEAAEPRRAGGRRSDGPVRRDPARSSAGSFPASVRNRRSTRTWTRTRTRTRQESCAGRGGHLARKMPALCAAADLESARPVADHAEEGEKALPRQRRDGTGGRVQGAGGPWSAPGRVFAEQNRLLRRRRRRRFRRRRGIRSSRHGKPPLLTEHTAPASGTPGAVQGRSEHTRGRGTSEAWGGNESSLPLHLSFRGWGGCGWGPPRRRGDELALAGLLKIVTAS